MKKRPLLSEGLSEHSIRYNSTDRSKTCATIFYFYVPFKRGEYQTAANSRDGRQRSSRWGTRDPNDLLRTHWLVWQLGLGSVASGLGRSPMVTVGSASSATIFCGAFTKNFSTQYRPGSVSSEVIKRAEKFLSLKKVYQWNRKIVEDQRLAPRADARSS